VARASGAASSLAAAVMAGLRLRWRAEGIGGA
jgi:hypothetical protein